MAKKYIDAEKIRAEIERRMKRENELVWNAELRGMAYPPSVDFNLITLTSLRNFLDTLEEEPDKSLEEAAEEYADKHGFRVPYDGTDNFYDDADVKASKEGFIAGAEWQMEQFEKNRLAYCDAASEEDCNRETDFAIEIIEKEHRQPTFLDAINYGMRLQKDALMKWLDGKMTIEGATEGFVGGYDSALKDVIEHINEM